MCFTATVTAPLFMFAYTVDDTVNDKDETDGIVAASVLSGVSLSLLELIIGITLVVLGALAYHGIIFNAAAALPLMITGIVTVSPFILSIIGLFAVFVGGANLGKKYALTILDN